MQYSVKLSGAIPYNEVGGRPALYRIEPGTVLEVDAITHTDAMTWIHVPVHGWIQDTEVTYIQPHSAEALRALMIKLWLEVRDTAIRALHELGYREMD